MKYPYFAITFILNGVSIHNAIYIDFKDTTRELKTLGLVSDSPLMLIYFSLPDSGGSVEKAESS